MHKYYKLFRKPDLLPKGCEYKDYGEKRMIEKVGFPVVGEVYSDHKLKNDDELHYELWEDR